ncbi:MAG: hypothetical protein JNN07_00270 [Verrucomicrobiales bacterium]|nr:hypothetical protein [Verrucomicrobiales bacterium]
MTLEQQEQLKQFPLPLRRLVEAELAIGNLILEIGHSHPAPPAGAFVKLANKISTHPRTSANGLDFYERNHSGYSGEFTNSQRFYFVLEPPNPPPEEPDMDTLRKALEPKTSLSENSGNAAEVPEKRSGGSLSTSSSPRRASRHGTFSDLVSKKSSTRATPLSLAEEPGKLVYHLHFRDPRPPHEIQHALERSLMTLFSGSLENHRLFYCADAKADGCHYLFKLDFLAALPKENCYLLRTEVSRKVEMATDPESMKRQSASWLDVWTRELTPAAPPKRIPEPTEHYQALCQSALTAEAHLTSVPAIQGAIIEGLRRGGRFTTSHKEGTTNIYWRIDRYIRCDEGDYSDIHAYTDESEFLTMLRRFTDFQVTRRSQGLERPEFDTWKLILRLLR